MPEVNPTSKKYLQRILPESWPLDRVLELSKITGLTGLAQIFIQAIGLLSGILIIRLLSTTEYAYYTLATTMLGTMVVLADGGIAAGVMAESGKVYLDKAKLGSVLKTGLELRQKFAIGSLAIAAPILIYLLHHQGASFFMALLILLSVIPAFYASLSGAIYAVPYKLRQDIKPLQKNLMVESLGRFALVFTLFALPWTFIALLGSGIPRIYSNWRLKILSAKMADWSQPANPETRKVILGMVKRLLPGAIYYCVSGQISIWLISFFGNTEAVAQIGALGRIAIVLTVVNTLFGTLIYPRFARLPTVRALLMKRLVAIFAVLLFVTSAAVFVVWLFSDQILWVLGDGYGKLNFELVLAVTASCISLMAGGAFILATQRGWAIHPGLSIPISVGGIIMGATLLDVTSLQGVLLFNIFTVSVQFFLNLTFILFKVNKIPQLPVN